MQTRFLITIIVLFAFKMGNSQEPLLIKTIEKIEYSQDTVLSVFDWICENIAYDVYKSKNPPDYNTEIVKFKNKREYENHLLRLVIRRKKGVCEDYSRLFDAILKELGYTSYVVSGYTRDKNGRVNTRIGHSWNAVRYNGKWKLYDPTWGAGYINEKERFVKKYNPKWFDTDPELMIKTHMPYDPIWQLSEQPINYDQFRKKNRTGNDSINQESMDFVRQIDEYLARDKKEQMQDQVTRSLSMGKGNSLVKKWRSVLNNNIGMYGYLSQKEAVTDAQHKANEAVAELNNYFKAKNKRFRGKRWSTDEASKHLGNAKRLASGALQTFIGVEVEDKRVQSKLKGSIRHAEKLIRDIEKEERFLKEYTSKN